MKRTEKQKVALVLSGGGARGIAHIGVIEELEKRGYEITSIAGTSMGSLIGGVYAAGRMNELKEWFYTLDKSKVFRLFRCFPPANTANNPISMPFLKKFGICCRK